jgi:hypothetical protein
LQALAAPVLPADVRDSVHAPDLALRVPAALVHDLAPAVLLQPVKHRVRSAHRRIAPGAAVSNIPRPKKAQ